MYVKCTNYTFFRRKIKNRQYHRDTTGFQTGNTNTLYFTQFTFAIFSSLELVPIII